MEFFLILQGIWKPVFLDILNRFDIADDITTMLSLVSNSWRLFVLAQSFSVQNSTAKGFAGVCRRILLTRSVRATFPTFKFTYVFSNCFELLLDLRSFFADSVNGIFDLGQLFFPRVRLFHIIRISRGGAFFVAGSSLSVLDMKPVSCTFQSQPKRLCPLPGVSILYTRCNCIIHYQNKRRGLNRLT